jgi:hypothetical protein
MDKLIRFLNLVADWFISIPGHWYYTAGVVLASIIAAPMLIQGVKRLHIKHSGREMTDVLVDFTITVTAALMASADFLLTNSAHMAYFLPFLGVVLPSIKAFAPTVYNVSKAIHSFTVDRKNKVPLSNSNLPDFKTIVPSVTSQTTHSGLPSSSMGIEATNTAPPADLFISDVR